LDHVAEDYMVLVFSVKWKSSKRAPKCEHPKWHKK